MGEYVNYRNKIVKIGTIDDMYYVSYQKYTRELKAGTLHTDGGITPDEYAIPDAGFRFRFPFPDEDHLPFGDIGKFSYDRSVKIKVDQEMDPFLLKHFASVPGKDFEIEILRQKLLHRESDGKKILALVVRDPLSGESYRMEDDRFIHKLTKEIIRNHIADEQDPVKKNFYRVLAARILKGYRMDKPAQKVRQRAKQKLTRKPRRGKGL